jgi:hypothetical protein
MGKKAALVQEGARVKLLSMLEVMPAAAYTCDIEGLITYYNQYAFEIWGRAPKLSHPVDRY